MEALGHEGLNNLLAAYTDKSAEAVCTFAYCEGPGHEPIIFQGRTEVSAPFSPFNRLLTISGENSSSKRSHKLRYAGLLSHPLPDIDAYFLQGWDPIFEYQGKTYVAIILRQIHPANSRWQLRRDGQGWKKRDLSSFPCFAKAQEMAGGVVTR